MAASLARLGSQPTRHISLSAAESVHQRLSETLSSGREPLRIFRLRSQNPYLNLSIEQHLLEVSHPKSTILLLYRNDPCVVIGRSQNPWLEVDLARLRAGLRGDKALLKRYWADLYRQTGMPSRGSAGGGGVPISLVRRRSGGGAVFHDEDNMNYSVIWPTAAFDRDLHAEMVARALRNRLGVQGVRVNERHDIVMDVSPERRQPGTEQPSGAPHDESLGFEEEAEELEERDLVVAGAASSSPAEAAISTFKISGSAYRVTRLRSLHHGTCLLNSKHLSQISPLLRSPAEGYIKSRGAASVRSPVRNVGSVGVHGFTRAVIAEFKALYQTRHRGHVTAHTLGWECMQIPEIRECYNTLRSDRWIYAQSPQFTFSTHPSEADEGERTPLPADLPPDFRASITVRHGDIQSCNISGLDYGVEVDAAIQDESLNQSLVGLTLHDITDWQQTLAEAAGVPLASSSTGRWMNQMFGLTTDDG